MQWIVSDALKYATQKTEQVNTLQKLDDRIEEQVEEWKGTDDLEDEISSIKKNKKLKNRNNMI